VTTYLVGLDASEHAADALAWARAVAAADERIVVLHAKDIPIVTGYEGAATVDPVDTEEMAGEFVAGVVGGYDDPRLDGRLIDGPAGQAIVEAAGTLGGDVVIVVGHGGSSKASLLVGSTAHHVVHHTDHPVVVVRGDLRIPVRHVVVGVDCSGDDEPDDRSMAALRWAVQLRGVEQIDVSHADFVPAVAAGPVREPGLESDAATAEDDACLHRAIAAATEGTGEAPSGASIVPVVAGGTGAFALIEASRDVDLVVIGTHGRSGLVELIVGSTTLEVLAYAHCPIAVVR
jgi:nucleotide-binding universal stress UspA family protein